MAENSHVDFFTNLDWTKSTEELLVSWADIALCYTWIFDKSYRSYNNVNYSFTIPIVILSTITGTLSMSLSTIIPETSIMTGQFVIGAVNIFIGILSTLQNFFRYAQQSELHLSATKDWAKLHRNIKIELSIERRYRKPAEEFVRYARQEYERLLNTRPVIPSKILNNFKRLYKNSDVIKPETLEKIKHLILDDDKNMIVVNNIPFAESKPKPIFERITSFFKNNISESALKEKEIVNSNIVKNDFKNIQTPPPSISGSNTPVEVDLKDRMTKGSPSERSLFEEDINHIKLDILKEDNDEEEINELNIKE